MQIKKLSIAVLFLTASGTFFYGQEVKKDTIAKEKNIEGIVIQGSGNKKTESAILGEQKKAIIQKQAISAEEISRKGISNVEQGLTKVTGITTVEGRGLFVRGLEERYNYLLINGLGSPSNNPFQKIIALKQFPTDVVGKLNIYKTFNSNLYGDFAGATFDIETLTIDKAFSKVEFGVGVNTISTFRNFKMAQGADGFDGYLGLNSEDRRLPSIIRNSRPDNYKFTREQSLNDFKDSWNVDNVKSLPNTSIGFTTVQKVKAGETGSLGVLFSLNQATDYQYREGQNNQIVANGGEVIFSNELQQKEYNYNLESSALLGLGYKNKGTNIQLNSIYLQNVSNVIQDNLGYKNGEIQNKGLTFFRTNQMDISRFLDLQLIGSQKISERHQIKAGGSYVINNYSQPDRKIMEGIRTDNSGNLLPEGQIRMNYGGNNLVRQYLDVDSKFYASGFAEYTGFFGNKGEKKEYPLQLSIGYNGFADVRKNSYRFIYGRPDPTADLSTRTVTVNIDTPDSVFNNSINNGFLRYEEGSDASQFLSNLYQFVNAGYLNLNLKPNDSWDILLGGRYENEMSIIRYYKLSANNPDEITKNKNYILPSLSIKKALNTKSNLRFSFSKTLTRPVLIELMPITYINPDNSQIQGNPNIKNSENYNVDLKWELYPSAKELFSANIFAKRLNNPIERSFLASSNATGVTETFFNAKSAQLAGVELEAILSLSRISESLEKFTFGTNVTVMYSDVKRSDDQLKTEKPDIAGFTDDMLNKRALQGAAPYVINADLKYEIKNAQNYATTFSLVYNVSGKKIYSVGASGSDVFYEKPINLLDFVAQKQIDKNWNLKFSVKNILNSKYRLEVGDESYIPMNVNTNFNYKNYYGGVDFNATVGYTF